METKLINFHKIYILFIDKTAKKLYDKPYIGKNIKGLNIIQKGSDIMNNFQDSFEYFSNIYKNMPCIDSELYKKYDVKRGLRDLNGKGVLTGLTAISEIRSSVVKDGKEIKCPGKLFYRGIDVEDIIGDFISERRFAFEETAYLLLMGNLPTKTELEKFSELLALYRRTLPTSFVRDSIMKAPSKDMMNTLSRSVLTLYAYDSNPDSTELDNVLRQCLQLIALFPMLAVYGYQAYRHYHDGRSLYIHSPNPEYSTAENILHLLRSDSKFSALEAKVLDIALVLHAEHGGGNNSSFTTHVVTSSGTDTYSAIAAALGSLKGPKHGGANIKVVQMMEDMKNKVKDWEDDEEIERYLVKLLNKEEFDRTGLIYGMGHAVYSISDPRATVFRSFVKELSAEKNKQKEFMLYQKLESLAPKVIAKERQIYKGVSANVDLYSGFAYSMLNLPMELYTPIFAIARIAGWSAHRMEEIKNAGKIIRPTYKSVCEERPYVKVQDRK